MKKKQLLKIKELLIAGAISLGCFTNNHAITKAKALGKNDLKPNYGISKQQENYNMPVSINCADLLITDDTVLIIPGNVSEMDLENSTNTAHRDIIDFGNIPVKRFYGITAYEDATSAAVAMGCTKILDYNDIVEEYTVGSNIQDINPSCYAIIVIREDIATPYEIASDPYVESLQDKLLTTSGFIVNTEKSKLVKIYGKNAYQKAQGLTETVFSYYDEENVKNTHPKRTRTLY